MRKMKDSGIDWIGDIPQEWNIKKLKFSCKIRNEKYTENKGKLDYFGLENIVSWNGKYVKSENIYDLSGANLCYKNDGVQGNRMKKQKKYVIIYQKEMVNYEKIF